MLRRSVVAVVALAGCHGLNTDFPDPEAGMRFASGDMARKSSASTQHVDVPFQLKPAGTDGTDLVLAFLQSVEPRGAKYISDVSVSLQLVYRGVPVECVSTIVVEADGTAPPSETWHPEHDARWAIDRQRSCQSQQPDASAPASADAGSGYQADFGASNTVDTQGHADCKLDPHERFDKRFEHLTAAKFAKPDLERVRKQYSDFKLVESAPECHRIERVVHQHIAANLYFMGNVDRGEPAAGQNLGNYH